MGDLKPYVSRHQVVGTHVTKGFPIDERFPVSDLKSGNRQSITPVWVDSESWAGLGQHGASAATGFYHLWAGGTVGSATSEANRVLFTGL